LKSVALKASGYAKKIDAIASAYKKDHKIEDQIKLTERERQILNDLYCGFSRAEIAASRYLSINTVKSVIQSLYIKLNADTNVDAVRIALEKELIRVR
jgi:LuxR family maltose regulon positive regulatory protein